MKITLDTIKSISNIDEKIDNSFNGTCFAYSWFLELKETDKILKIEENNEIIGFMPLFLNETGKEICQSTMYIPYGGPVIFDVPKEERNKIRFIRKIENALSKYLIENFEELSFSTDNNLIDIMPFIRNGFIPELRYTYKLDLTKNINEIYAAFGNDRKKEIRRAKKNDVEFYLDQNMKYLSPEKCVEWEKKYNFPSSADFVREYMKTTMDKNRGMCFVAKKGEQVYGAVHMAWDKTTAYILYSYFDKEHDVGSIAFLYYKIFEYLKDIQNIKYIDFEGSVYETVEDFNISFGAYQSRYYNLHYSKKNQKNIYESMYVYYDK